MGVFIRQHEKRRETSVNTGARKESKRKLDMIILESQTGGKE